MPGKYDVNFNTEGQYYCRKVLGDKVSKLTGAGLGIFKLFTGPPKPNRVLGC